MGAMESGSSRGGSTKMSLASQLNPGKREKSGNGQKLWAPASLQSSETVVVAIDATKAVTKHALEWALTNAVQPGDRIILLALIPLPSSSGWKLWSLQRLSSECASGLKSQKEAEDEAKDCCRHLLKQLQKHCDAKKIQVAVKIAYAAAKGSTAVEAQKIQATWIVVDRHLRKEVKHCMKKLQCNLVMIDRYNSKILRLNLKRSPGAPNFSFENASTPSDLLFPLPNAKTGATVSKKYQAAQNGERTAYTVSGTPLSSPEMGTPFTTTEHGVTTSTSSSEPGTSPHSSTEPGAFVNSIKGNGLASLRESIGSGISTEIETASENGYRVSDSENESPLCTATDASPEQNFGTPSLKISSFRKTQPPIGNRRASAGEGSIRCPLDGDNFERNESSYDRNNFDKRRPSHARLSSSTREGGSQNREPQNSLRSVMSPLTMPSLNIKADKNAPSQKLTIADLLASVKSTSKRRIMENQPRKATLILDRQKLYPEAGACISNDITFERTSSLRKAMSLTRHNPPGPPPLCSICQHKAPMFGKPPRVFTYSELELATGGFSNANFLAEGGFGSVHRGVLPDGQAVAVKQHKLASSQGDVEFCSEVEVLSCAQHRNVVMLIGYCIEGSRRLLVYEFICNGSLDAHLYGRGWNPLEWHSRHKIAIGAARGLRYLHEECRVGCIVHRDMRPNNILLTHDFEPMVGDFGLARWQPDGELGVETRVIGTFGYLAPEYAQSGQITEKADVYSFGVVLLELVTGRKAIDISRPKGEQCLTEWARPLLEEQVFHNMVDPRIEDCYNEHEVRCMLHAASLCIRQDPQLRPRMSQVLRILEGDVALDMGNSPTSSGSIRLSFDKFPVINSGYVSRLSLSNSSSERIRQSTELRRSGSSTPNLRANRPRTSFDRQGSQFSKLDGPIRKLSYEDLRTTYKDKAGF